MGAERPYAMAGLQQRLSRVGLEVYDGGNVAVPVVEEVSHEPG